MNFLLKLLFTALAVIILAYVLPGVAVASFGSALITAFVLAFFRAIVKPILVVITIPITIVTLGLFLLVINGCIILMVDYFIPGFNVDGFVWALIFSLLLSFLQSVLFGLFEDKKAK